MIAIQGRMLTVSFLNKHLCQCGHEWETQDIRKVSRHPCPSGKLINGHHTAQVDSIYIGNTETS